MKKLRLELEALEVVSFATEREHEVPQGTVHGQGKTDTQQTEQTSSFFTLGGHDSCYGMCMTYEYDTCQEAGPTVGTSCDYYCTAPTIGCTGSVETQCCA